MEAEWIEKLRKRPGTERIGDDAALLGDTLVTVDMLTEGVDFLCTEAAPEWIGRKALAVNLSDIAAMAGVPESFVCAVALPKQEEQNEHPVGVELAERLYAGMEPLIQQYGLVLAGGDTNTWHGGLVISVTMLGRATSRGVWRRSGGKPGDMLFVTGPLGGSILRKQFFFEPRILEALFLNENYDIHAAMDISDGLSLDLNRLATESNVGALLDEAAIPISTDALELARTTGRPPLTHALSDGEDFELLLAVPPEEGKKWLDQQPLQERFGVTLFAIGHLMAHAGLRITDPDGNPQPLKAEGFLH